MNIKNMFAHTFKYEKIVIFVYNFDYLLQAIKILLRRIE